MDPDTGRLNVASGRMAGAMVESLAGCAEVVAPRCSRRQFRDDVLDTVRRSDRMFTNCATGDLRVCNAAAAYVGDVCSARLVNNHAPLVFRADVPRRASRRTVPTWVTHHEFVARLAARGAAVDSSSLGPFDELAAWKKILYLGGVAMFNTAMRSALWGQAMLELSETPGAFGRVRTGRCTSGALRAG